MSNANKTESKKKTVKRRTFLGCITCRNRKVKCDGRRPKCLRCEKANRECLGYGFTLKFIDPMTTAIDGSLVVIPIQVENEKSNTAKRQQLELMQFPASQRYTTFEEIDLKLEQLNEEKFSGQDVISGPFSLFASKSFTKKAASAPETSFWPSNIQQKTPLHFCEQTEFTQDLNKIGKSNGEKLPSISSIIDNNKSSLTKLPGFPISRILPLVPALELHHQRIKQQEATNLLSNSVSYSALPESNTAGFPTKHNGIIPKPIWIHPRLEIDAILTYQTLVGSADALTSSWDVMKSVIFAEKYNTVSQLKNRIVDKMNLDRPQIDFLLKKYINDAIRALNGGEQSTVPVSSFTNLLRSQRVQELIRLFVKSQPSVLILSYGGCVLDTIVIPLLYKIVGELMVFECSVGLPGDWVGKVSEHGIEFRDYCDILKRTYCMVALSITSFSQYKVLFNEYGIYDGSLNLFRCYIAFREMSLLNLSTLIKPLLSNPIDSKIHVTNATLVHRLIKVGLFKELVLTLILAIYQDSNVDIIIDYTLLYGVLDGLRSHYQHSESKDKQMDEIWEWFRYLFIFYKSCSKIDFENYEIDEEGFEDVRSDYNLIEKFQFNDFFEQNEFNQIEIQSTACGRTRFDHASDSSDYEDGLEVRDNEDDAESDDGIFEDEMKLEIPKRLAKRPDIVDKPPRSFTVRFHFSENQGNQNGDNSCDSGSEILAYSSETTDGEDNAGQVEKSKTSEDYDPDNIDTTVMKEGTKGHHNCIDFGGLNKPGNDDQAESGNDEAKSYLKVADNEAHKGGGLEIQEDIEQSKNECFTANKNGAEVNVLTGLATSQSNMSFKKREQLSNKKGKIHIPHPSSITWKTTEGRPSSIELSFGLPLSLLQLIERAVKLADHKNWCLRKMIFPRNFPKFCCDLEEELINWKLEWDLYSEDRTTDGELQFHSLFHKALYHLAVSFYNTTLMFFFRLIKEIDPSLLQNHVTSTIDHLEQLRNLSLRSDFLKDMKLFPPFWCFFISGSDALAPELRHRFDDVARKMFVAGNKWIGKQIMMEIWETDNSSENDGNSESGGNSWLDVLKDWDVSGFN